MVSEDGQSHVDPCIDLACAQLDHSWDSHAVVCAGTAAFRTQRNGVRASQNWTLETILLAMR